MDPSIAEDSNSASSSALLYASNASSRREASLRFPNFECPTPTIAILPINWIPRIILGRAVKEGYLDSRLECLLGLRVEESDSSGGDLHAVSARVSSGLGIYRLLHAIHTVKFQLYDLVVGGLASRRADDLVNCVLLQPRHLLGKWDVVLPVLLVE